MPRALARTVELYYESIGEGPPFVLQAHDHTPWLFFQAPVFSQRYRVLAYDRRGTGRSASPPGDWSAADLANDLARFLDALGIERAREWASWIPGAQFVVLPGAHHAAPREAAPAWNAVVQDFLDRHGIGAESTA